MDDPVAQLGRVGAVAALAGEARGQGGVLAVELADQALQGVAAKAGVLRGDCRARKLLGCSGEAPVRAARHAVQPLPQHNQVLERAWHGHRRAADIGARVSHHPCLSLWLRRLGARRRLSAPSSSASLRDGRDLVHEEDGMLCARGAVAHGRRLLLMRQKPSSSTLHSSLRL